MSPSSASRRRRSGRHPSLGRFGLVAAYLVPALLIGISGLARPSLSQAADPTAEPTVSPSYPPSGGQLVVSLATGESIPANPQDLTAAGATDWAIWGYGAEGTSTALAPDVRKADGGGISDLTDVNPDEIALRGHGQFTGPFSFSWVDGTGPVSANSVRGGLQHYGSSGQNTSGHGFTFTVPAGVAAQRLTFWVHAHGGNGRMTASIPDVTDVVQDLQVGSPYGGENQPGRYTIEFAADQDGRELVVTYVLDHVIGEDSASQFPNVAIYAAALSPVVPTTVEVPAPVLLQAVPQGPSTYLIGRLAEQPGTFDLRFLTSSTCDNGQLGGEPTTFGTTQIVIPTPAEGEPVASYFAGSIPNTAVVSTYVAAEVSGPAPYTSSLSACIVAGPNNNNWTDALPLDLSGGSSQVDGWLDSEGNARWFKFPIVPGARATINLSGLPANYNLFVFKDIGQAYDTLTSTADLTRISAEFAPSAYAPSAYAPSAYAPSAYAPSAYAPSAYAPSAYAPSAYAPSAYAPSAYAPSAYAPSAYAPSAYAPSAYAPSAYAPSAYAPSAYAPDAFSPSAYASAQVRSLIGVAALPGPSPETVVADTWNNTGFFYVRVSGENGAFDPSDPFTLKVTLDGTDCVGVKTASELVPLAGAPTATGPDFQTIILTDTSRMAATITGNSAAEKATLAARLATFKARPDIKGVVVDVHADARVAALNAQADAPGKYACPYAKNLVASAIKDIVTAYRAANPGLRYVVLVGNDDVIPFYRYPDQGLLGPEQDYVPPVAGSTSSEASLRTNQVLGQDEYGSATSISLRATTFPVPDLAVGRVVETAAEATVILDAYLSTTNGVVAPPTGPLTSLVTGYDFIADAADKIKDELTLGTGSASQTLITPKHISPLDTSSVPFDQNQPKSWNATDLRSALLGSRHDLIFLGGHFSASSALAADFATSMLTSELTSSNLTNAIVFSIGCHSGYNLVDPHGIPGVTQTLDWAQAFARKGAALIGGTGYQYGDTDFIEYSERIYTEFARQLRYESTPGVKGAISIGEALVRAKQEYLRTTPDIRGLHEKALLESTLFGLPMLSVDLPDAGRLPVPDDNSVITSTTGYSGPGAASVLGLKSAELDVPITYAPAPNPTVTSHEVPMTNLDGGSLTATYFTGPDGNTTNPAEPALPLDAQNVSVPGLVLRGVGFLGGDYHEQSVTPLTGAPNTEIRGVHIPFASSVFYPMRPWTVNYFDAVGSAGGATRLLVTPAQHRQDLGAAQSTVRLYDDMDVRLFYSNNITTYGSGPTSSTPALSAPPTITGVSAEVNGNTVDFRANVVGDPAAGIQEVWVTYTGHDTKWESLDLAQDATDSTLWTRSLTLPTSSAATNLRFIVQAVNGVGLVSVSDNLGAYFAASLPGTPEPVATSTISLAGSPTSGAFGSTQSVRATLLSNSSPVEGKTVVFTLGGAVRIGTTGFDGVASTSIDVTSTSDLRLTATFDGDSTVGGSTTSQAFAVNKAATQLTLTGPGATAGSGDLFATLKSGNARLTTRTVGFRLTAPNGTQSLVTAITDITGIARITVPAASGGAYGITAYFGSVVSLPGGGVLDLTDPAYGPSTATIWPFTGFLQPVDNLPVLNVTKAGSTVPVKFSLGGDRGLAIFAPLYPGATKIACQGGAPVDPIEETNTSNSGLTYDPTTKQYKYNWKTPKSYLGLCYRLDLKLVDGRTYSANFQFK